ncbi:hypothetical protein AcW1_005828 [Taiwanofungus camphoratus]|nr:hypothetical protein AcW1_005828 [Antrodia cinnamomea]
MFGLVIHPHSCPLGGAFISIAEYLSGVLAPQSITVSSVLIGVLGPPSRSGKAMPPGERDFIHIFNFK